MHTEATLNHLDKTTTVIRRELRSFAATTQAEYKTVELPGETASRARRSTHKRANTAAVDPSAPPPPPPPRPVARGKFLNLLTYKFHALADYVRSIRLFGTTDSYSTQTVCPRPRHYDLLSTHKTGGARTPLCEEAVWANQQKQRDKADDSDSKRGPSLED